MRAFLFILFLLSLVIQSPFSYAESKPASKKEELGQLDQRLKNYKDEKQSLQREAGKAQANYEKTKKSLIKASAKVQKNQGELHAIETRLRDLRSEQANIKAELDAEREAMAQMITALERIRRTPPQAMIARPATPIDTARGAMLLQRVLPVLHVKAQALKEKSERYAANEQELEDKQRKLLAISEDLAERELDLSRLVDSRKKLYTIINTNLAARSKEIEKASKRAKSLTDLVQRLEEERTRNARRQAERTSEPVRQAALPPIGTSQLPLRGKIRTRYNQKDDFGAQSKGVSIEGRGGALIVSPMGGTIRFAGYFKNYGNMLIIEHKNGYHSLIAGLEKIDTVVEQNVSAGEPLGNLYSSKNGKAPTLYFELRHKGKAINPARKFTELG